MDVQRYLILAACITLCSSCTNPFIAVGNKCLFFGSTLTLNHQSSADICIALNGMAARIDEPGQLRSIVEYIQEDVTLQISYWIDGADIQGEWVHTGGDTIPLGTPFWATYYNNATGYGQEPIEYQSGSCLALRPQSHYYFTSNSCDEEMSPLCEEITGASSSVRATDNCGSELTASSGLITSPEYYTGEQLHPYDCTWTISRGVDSVIHLTINDVWMYSSVASFYLSIRDGPDSSSPELGRYGGVDTATPISLVTSGNQAYIRYDAMYRGGDGWRGFSLSYNTEEWNGNCIYDYSSATGSIHSPWYPGMYPPNLDCSWRITVDEDSYISLTVISFDTQSAKDIVKIRDGAFENSTLLSELSGFVDLGYELSSSGNQIFVSFSSDNENLSNEGFALMWTAKKSCPAPYLNVGQMCIHIELNDLTFGMSGIACQEASGELASINDSQDLRDLYVFLQNQGIADYNFWLGGTDEEEEGTWLWKDGRTVPKGTPFWGTTGTFSEVQEPDGKEEENCLLLNAAGKHYFRDARCDIKAPALCMLSFQ